MPSICDRRDFLKQSVCTTALAAGSYAAAAKVDAAARGDKLNIGIVGVGNRGASNIAEINSENLVALCDVDRKYLDAMSARYPAAKCYADFRAMLEQPDLDAVLISAPDHVHYHAAMLAMQRGLHVYCEKPLAHSIWEIREMAAAAEHFGVVTQFGNQHHASDGYRRVSEIVQSGAIGRVNEVHAWTNRPIWPQGVRRPEATPQIPEHLDWQRWLGPAPARPYHDIYHPAGWRGWFDFGCGALGDMGPHLLDPVVWALGLNAPTVISAETSEVTEETFPAWSVVHFEFSTSQPGESITLVWYDGDKQPPTALTGIQRLPPNGVLFIAERAKLYAPPFGGAPIVIPQQPGDAIELPDPYLPKSPGQHREWTTACKQQATTSCDFRYGARLTEICLLGNLAIGSGQTIHWDARRMQAGDGTDISHLVRREYRDGWSSIRFR